MLKANATAGLVEEHPDIGKRGFGLLAFTLAIGCVACGSGAPTETLRVPSTSMLPTLKTGQEITVSERRNYLPKLGDIVAFHPPGGADSAVPVCGNPQQGAGHPAACAIPTSRESSQVFVKRVVAGPGDTIKIIGGHVDRNGAREDDASYTLACGGDPICSFPASITIPPGDYFVLGDNRGQSDDSRFWGPVPRNWIVGKVE